MATEEPNTPSRSAKGCWTCRARHRKCDEKSPVCDECAERTVTCHGYGAKPTWMDGGPREREERARIKSAVKQNWRRTRTRRTATPSESEVLAVSEMVASMASPRSPEDVLLEKPDTVATVYYPPETSLSASPWQNPQEDGGLLQNPFSPQTAPPLSQLVGTPLTMAELTFEEADLIMHYLDHVFPLQFPYHSSSPRTSRGWLFWLLMKNKPLHQAVLSLSALHQYAISGISNNQRRDELNFRHVRVIQEVQQFLGQSIDRGLLSKQQVVELLACGTSLISFEVFRGGTGDWQPHLYGLASALNNVSWLPGAVISVDEQSSRSTDGPEDSAQPAWVDNAFKHLATIVLWFELLSCVSTSREPILPYKTWITRGNIDMSEVMGCQNWAMEEIGNIACLETWKESAIQSKTLSMQNLVMRGHEIERRLERGLKDLDTTEQTIDISDFRAVTRIYALAALVQLHTILWGPRPEILEFRSAVARAVLAFNEIEERKLKIRGLVWSLCIVGCMAEPCHQTFFDKLISVNLSQSPGADFGNLESTLQIMRKCWEKQRLLACENYNWGNAMAELEICILFI